MKRNPKQAGTNLFDCIPQKGPCPNNCSQCFYNRNFYLPINCVHFPYLFEVGDGIVRVNSGHDSNIKREWVITSTKCYPKRFFNTSIPNLDFPDPVVFTANRCEEDPRAYLPCHFVGKNAEYLERLMFVRLRTSSTNLVVVADTAKHWGEAGIPVLLTFMRYYDENVLEKQNASSYTQRTHVTNSYWCPTTAFMRYALGYVREFNSKIEMCGTPNSSLCGNCLRCERYYYSAKRRMRRGQS